MRRARQLGWITHLAASAVFGALIVASLVTTAAPGSAAATLASLADYPLYTYDASPVIYDRTVREVARPPGSESPGRISWSWCTVVEKAVQASG